MKNEHKLTPMVVGYLVHSNQILLGRRKQTSTGLGQGILSGIGGKVGDLEGLESETAEQALVREIQEEIGVTATSYRHVGQITFLFPNKPKWNQLVEVYIVDEWSGEPIASAEIEPAWFDITEIPFGEMWDDSKYYLPEMLEGKRVEAIFTYDSDNKVVAEKTVNFK
ncbi:MAG TPA: 8-oxo-dGTP diphosphatase [Magnetospirillaceae bacterium]|nr:8-oxo-dGTP diphosphatase [Magnetospirillaceae bacterium]